MESTVKFREVPLHLLPGLHKARVMVVINIIVLIICRPSKILAVFTITGFTATLVGSHFNFDVTNGFSSVLFSGQKH